MTNDPQINLSRIKARVERGGHDVPSDKIISRYEKSMTLMLPVFEEAQRAIVYDNSKFYPIPVFTKGSMEGYACLNGYINHVWVQNYLILPAKERGIDIRFGEL